MRLRLTAAVTLAVGLTLGLASVALVTSLSRTLVGRAQAAAGEEVDRAAGELARGEPVSRGLSAPSDYITSIQVVDEHGTVVQSIPPPGSGSAPPGSAPPPGDVAEARARALAEAAAAGDAADPAAAAPDDLVVASRTVDTPAGSRTVLAVSRLGPVTQSVRLVVRALLIAASLLVVLVGAATWFAVDRTLRPIEAIRRRAEEISLSTLTERLPRARTGDEVDRLTTTLNRMLDRLDEGATRQRGFISDASHELRTPLAAMRAELEVSLAHRGPADWRGVAARLLDDHRRLERLTGDLLMLSRTDDPAAAARAEPVELDGLVAAELDAVTHARLRVALEPVTILGAPPELVRLVRNLLDNADRHAAGAVDVRLRREGDRVVLTVDDDGPGIPPEHRDRVFDRFFRLDSGRDRASGGTGLGLAMVRSIARRHGGDAVVTDAPLGGARLEVRLPVAPT